VFTITIGFIYYKLLYGFDIPELSNYIGLQWTMTNITFLCLVFLLMPLNWWLECIKWKLIMQQHESVTNKQAYQSVLSGITLSIITPNAIGDIVGKSLYLQSFSKTKGAAASIVGGIAQTVATSTIGSCGLLYILYIKNFISNTQLAWLFPVLLILHIVLIYGYVNIQKIPGIRKWPKISIYINVITHYSQFVLFKLLLLSILRLLTFSVQYYLLLLFFGIPIPIIIGIASIASIFLVHGFVPSFLLIEMGIRGALALFFIGQFSTFNLGILQAAYSLWIINMMLPGLVGLFYLLTFKWKTPS
jgi:hypothetical protein